MATIMSSVAIQPRTCLLTGVPRGGTTLACRLLGEAADTVALFEPMSVAELPRDPTAACADVLAFIEQTRHGLLTTGRAPSKLREGAVPDNPIAEPEAGSGQRRLTVEPGWLQVNTRLPDDFMLVVKHNAAFAALLPGLAERVPTLALVRNPVAVLASWQTVPLPVADGRIPAGERLDPALAARLAEEPDRDQRQYIILDWFFARFALLPAGRVLRYEDIIASRGESLFRSVGVAAGPRELMSRNANPAYRGRLSVSAHAGLRAYPGAWRDWYDQAELDAAWARLCPGTGVPG